MPDAFAQLHAEPETLAAALGVYLGADVESLRVLASGWETTLYEFSLGSPSAMLPGVEPGAPLVLRIYSSLEAADKGFLEHRIISYLAAVGYPVPQPHLFEAGGAAIGGPFLVMERLRGGPLFAVSSFPRAFKTFSAGFVGFVRAQARLHRIAVQASTLDALQFSTVAQNGAATNVDNAAARLLTRALDTIQARIEQGPLPGLASALARLRRDAPAFQEAPASLLHLDYHPQNVLVSGFRVTGIVDWANAAIGDRHFDAATTAVMLSTSAMEHPRWMRDNVIGNNLRRTFNAFYLTLYEALAPMDLRRLRYYQGLAGALRLSMLGMMRMRGPQSVGFHPSAISQVTPDVLRLLNRYVARKTGTKVSVP